MRLTILTTFLAAALCRAALGASAPVTIEHQRVGCVVSGKFPRLESRMDPADAVAHARLYFRAEAGSAWYFVEMKRAAAVFQGVLPKPKKDARRIHYYIETTSRDLTTSRTEEFAPEVVGNAGDCKGGMVAAGLGSASVVVSALSGAPAVPVGFGGGGLVTASAGGTVAGGGGGGLGTTAVVVGGVAVVGGAVAVIAKNAGGENDNSGQCGAPSLVVLARSATTLSLQWTQPSPSGCYTVDYLTGVASCSDFPQHGNILPVQGSSVTVSGLTPSTTYHIHVHPLDTCPNGNTGAGTTNVVFVNTLAAGAPSQSVSLSDYQSCGCPR
jgi:hypothetical protein